MSQPAHACLTRLEEIVGSADFITDPRELSQRKVDGLVPSAVVRPADAAQVAEVIRFANDEKLALIPCGGGTKLGIGLPPARYDVALDLTRMNRVLAYDPRDLTLGVEPGLRMEELSSVLAKEGQFLPLAVPFFERATIGGVVATNASSPLRHAYGGVRDFCLGMEFVTGDGAVAKSGGRVVKNVTGYDLHKLLIGSLGTLAVITRINFRTFPLLATRASFVASFAGAEAAFAFCRAIAQSVLTPQIVEIADPGAAHVLFSGHAAPKIAPEQWSVVVTAAGHAAVVDRHAHELGHIAAAGNADEFLRLGESEESLILSRLSEFPRLLLDAVPSVVIFRIGAVPTALVPLLSRLRELAAQNQLDFAALTRASGTSYAVFLPAEGDAAPIPRLGEIMPKVFQACSSQEFKALATLESCPPELKNSPESVWGRARPDFALMQGVKNAFDPNGVLSPGRFAGGI